MAAAGQRDTDVLVQLTPPRPRLARRWRESQGIAVLPWRWPGLSSGLHNVNNVTGDALDLFKQAYWADRGQQTAVVAWQGYDAPDGADVLLQGAAERGAKLLAGDVNAMRVTHAGPIGTLAVVGHSYGSTTTGLALQREHLDVDQVALIGSPGVGGCEDGGRSAPGHVWCDHVQGGVDRPGLCHQPDGSFRVLRRAQSQ